MNEVVRRAEPADSAQLSQLEAEARHHLIDQRGGAALLTEQPPIGDWAAARCQCGVFKVYAGADVEPVLSRRRMGMEAPVGKKRGGCIAQNAR